MKCRAGVGLLQASLRYGAPLTLRTAPSGRAFRIPRASPSLATVNLSMSKGRYKEKPSLVFPSVDVLTNLKPTLILHTSTVTIHKPWVNLHTA